MLKWGMVTSIVLLLLYSFLISQQYLPHDEPKGTVQTKYKVERDSFDLYVNGRGFVKPAQTVPISSKISGNNAKIVWLMKEGTTVRSGLLVARFDTKPFMDQLDQAEQEHADAFTTYQEALKALGLQQEEEGRKLEEANRKVALARAEAADIIQGSGPLEKMQIEQRLRQKKRALAFVGNEIRDLNMLYEKGYISVHEREKLQERFVTLQEDVQVISLEMSTFNDYIWPQMKSKAKLLVKAAETDVLRVRYTSDLFIQKRLTEVEKCKRLVENKIKAIKLVKQDLINCDIYAPTSGTLLYLEVPQQNGRRKIQIGDSVWCRFSLPTA